MTSRSLQRLFLNLSRATQKVEERHNSHDKLRSYLQKIKIVSTQSAKKSVISSEMQKLEKHIAEMLDKKLSIRKEPAHKGESHKLKQKEAELDQKIAQMNSLLVQVGKKVNEKKFKEQLGQKSIVEELEDKLYALESKYYSLKDNPDIPSELLGSIEDKISLLKQKIREIKNK